MGWEGEGGVVLSLKDAAQMPPSSSIDNNGLGEVANDVAIFSSLNMDGSS